jgi:7-keto-8-aminopelargonate synthetase-like enzyme
MDGTIPPLAELLALAHQYEAISVVDEAHALGLWGDAGQGLSQGWDVILGTLSKAIGSQGGFAAASERIIDYLLNKARSFIFTTGLSPVCVGAARAAVRIIQSEPSRARAVLERAQRLRDGLERQGVRSLKSSSQIVPYWIGDAGETIRRSEILRQKKIYAPAIRPPTVHANECRLRFSITFEHSEKQIDSLLDALAQ